MNNAVYTMLQQIKANPAQLLASRFNLPANLNDPTAILNHLLQTGQITQQQVNSAYQLAQRFR